MSKLTEDNNQAGNNHGNTGYPGSGSNASGNQSNPSASGGNAHSGNNAAGHDHSSSGIQQSQQTQPEWHPSHDGVVGDMETNVHDAESKVSEARQAMTSFLNGDANIVDAAMAVKGAYDAVTQLTSNLSSSLMMPVMKALGPFKGQAILPAAKQMDPVMGIDVHMVTIPPSPPGVPIPMPHPYIGMLFHAKDWVSCAINTYKKTLLDKLPDPAEDDKSVMASVAKNKEAIAGIAMGLANLGASVKFGDVIPRAITGTACKNIPHIPVGAGFSPAFDAAVAKNDGKAFLGSFFVVADGDPMVGSFHLNYDCWDIGVVDLFKALRGGGKIKNPDPPEPEAPKAELFVPSGIVMPIPSGRPVLVNSIPTPINPLAILDKLFKAGLAKLKRHAVEGIINRVKNTGLGKKMGCDFWTAVSKEHGTGQSHPVDVAGGYFYTANEDFKLPGPIPLVWERIWQSFSSYNGPLGYSWHHSYDMALGLDFIQNIALIRLADGRPATFDIPTLNNPTYNRTEKLTLHLHEEGYYYATDVKNLIYRFTEKEYKNLFSKTDGHLLQSIANRNGFAIRLSYDKNALLTQIIDSAGRVLKVNNNGQGKITSIEAPDPRFNGRGTFAITSYSYTPDGDMSSQADALNQTMYFEYANHLMVKEVWRNGCVWQFRYDKEKGPDAKCIEVWGTGGLLHYKFDYTDPAYTIVTNSRGFKKKFYHKNGVVIKYVDPLDAEWQYHYNQFNELEWETDPLGNQKSKTYDEWGNIESVIEANGAFLKISYGSGILKHSPIAQVDKMGGKWKWDYDVFGNLVKQVNPIKAETKYEYEDGFLKTITNVKGSKITLEHDLSGNLIRTIAPNGYEMQLFHDVLGNRIKVHDSAGNTRKVEFNICSLPEVIHEPDGNIRNLKFDAENNMIQAKDKHYDICFGYDPANRLAFRSQAGYSVNYRYDTEGSLVSLTNENGDIYSFEIDAADRIIKETGFEGLTRHYKRNATGKVEKMEMPGNKFTLYEYDVLGNIIEARYNDDSFERYGYNSTGLLITAVNSNSNIGFERDILGRIIKEKNAENFINYQYDLFGNCTKINSSLGADIINEFDEFGNAIATRANTWESKLNYDKLGLEIERIFPGNISCQWIRDKLGRPTRQRINKSGTILQNRQYTWDVNYRLQRIADSETGVTQFMHDEIGSLAKTIFSDGTEQLRNPDPVGNLFNSPDRKDRDYSKGGKLLRANGTHSRYDDVGNLIEKKDASGKIWRYQWYVNGMLRSVTRPDGNIVIFTYDALGRRLSKQYKNTITKWLWDGNKPLHEWKENASIGIKLGNGAVNKDGTITWLFDEVNFAPVAKISGDKTYTIITDHLGTPYQMYSSSGQMIWNAQLDSCGKIRMVKGDEGSCPFRYQGQYEDVETGLYYNRFRYYDTDGVYISEDPLRIKAGIKLYSYVVDTNIWYDPYGLAPLCVANGTSQAPFKGQPDSIYEQLDHTGQVSSRTFYDSNGHPFARQDFDHSHGGLQPHEHNMRYNAQGQPIAKKTTRSVPPGYDRTPS